MTKIKGERDGEGKNVCGEEGMRKQETTRRERKELRK